MKRFLTGVIVVIWTCAALLAIGAVIGVARLLFG